MRSSNTSEVLDLERGLRVTPADVAAARRFLGRPVPSFEEYVIWLASLPPPGHEQLKARPGPKGEPFVLPSGSQA